MTDTKTVKFKVIGNDPEYMLFNTVIRRGETVEFSTEYEIEGARHAPVLKEIKKEAK